MCADNVTDHALGEKIATANRGGVHFPKTLISSFDGPGCDAFGRMRVSNPTTIFDSKLLGSDDAPLFWEEKQVSGTSTTPTTPTEAKPYVDLASVDVTAGVFVRQTYRRFNYQPGKGHLILLSGVLELASGTKTGCERRMGPFDDNNGAFFESDAGVIGVTVRTNDSSTPVDTTVIQSAWNLDNLDGSGDADNPSGITADWTKAQIFVYDWQWLSAGRIRFGVEIGGVIIYVHEHNAANVTAIPWSSTPNLPLRYELISTTGSGVCSMRCICSSVVSEGGQDDIGAVHFVSTEGAEVVTDTADVFFAVVGLRLKTTHAGTTVKLIETALQIQTASEFLLWALLWKPTVAGTFTYSDVANSAVQRALGATANTVTNGTQIAGGFLESGGVPSGGARGGGVIETSLILGMDVTGLIPDEVVLCVMPVGGISAVNVEGGIVWRELS